MNGLFKIGDISQRLNITTRTLRYYEEIGLIKSTRNDETKYRYYDFKAISRTNQIIILRNLTFSIKEIQEVLSTRNSNYILTIFNDKLKYLKDDLSTKAILIDTIEKMISIIKVNTDKNQDSELIVENIFNEENLRTEDGFKNTSNMEMLNMQCDIRILKLRPMRVAYYSAVSENPEDDAWNIMRQWIKENSLDELFTTRYFGFNSPDPSLESNTYGYEVWAAVNHEIQGNEYIGIKEFKGGLYAVANCNMYDIVKVWKLLYNFIEKSHSYKIGTHQWIEEHLILNDASWGSNMQVDLYCPIEMM